MPKGKITLKQFENVINSIENTLPEMYVDKGQENRFYSAYHIRYIDKGINYNIYYDKDYKNVSICIYNRNETDEFEKLKNILETKELIVFENKIKEIFK
jgi:hypothetical protein